ncbi:hypothetical protein D3C72_1762010 [compost metagenome]
MACALFGLGDVSPCGEDEPCANGQVDEEAHAPRKPVGKQPADNQADASRDPGRRGIVGDRARTFRAGGKVGLQQGERRRRQRGSPDTLYGTCCNEPLGRLGKPDGE